MNHQQRIQTIQTKPQNTNNGKLLSSIQRCTIFKYRECEREWIVVTYNYLNKPTKPLRRGAGEGGTVQIITLY
jgi:hypothetical protein